MDRDLYRVEAEEFSAQLGRESYRHFAGLADRSAIDSLYARHTSLFDRRAVDSWREAAAGEPSGRSTRELLRFCVEGHLATLTQGIDSELARRESRLRIPAGGDEVGLRESLTVQANEPDAQRRAQIERLRLEAQDSQLNPLRREALDAVHQRSRELGWADHRALCEDLMGIDLAALARQSAALAEATDLHYPAIAEPELRRTLGVGFDGLARSDLPRFFRNAGADIHFPAAALLPALDETMHHLGLDLDAGGRIHLDIESRAGKSSRAFCAAARVPEEVYLVVARSGGREDFVSLLHECGHAQHLAGIDPSLRFEARRLGDAALGEAYAFLFDRLVDDPAWLRRRLGVRDEGRLAGHARAQRLMYLRRYGAKLQYELELHSRPPERSLDDLADVYAERLSAAMGVSWPRETWLSDVDPGLYVANYLRAWVLEAGLRQSLRERFGSLWFEQAAAGAFLRELWHEGRVRDADELLADLFGARLDLGLLLADLALAGEPIGSS